MKLGSASAFALDRRLKLVFVKMASFFGLEGLPTLLGGGVLGAVITLAVSRYGVAKPRPSYRGEGGAKGGCADRSSILRRRRRRTQEDVPTYHA